MNKVFLSLLLVSSVFVCQNVYAGFISITGTCVFSQKSTLAGKGISLQIRDTYLSLRPKMQPFVQVWPRWRAFYNRFKKSSN